MEALIPHPARSLSHAPNPGIRLRELRKRLLLRVSHINHAAFNLQTQHPRFW